MDEAEINPFAADYGGYTPSTTATRQGTSATPWQGTSVATAATGAAYATGPSPFASEWNEEQKFVQAMAAPTSALPKTVELKSASRPTLAGPELDARSDNSPVVAQLRAELRAKEQALRDKDAVIASLQEEVQRMQQTTRSANWPRFLPLVYLNIDGEVRDGVRRRHVKQMYYYWMFVVACYFVNFFVVAVAYWSNALAEVYTNGYIPFMWQIIIILLAPPLSFLVWFRTLYNAARVDSPTPSSKYWLFFVNFFVHLVVTVLCMAGVFFENGGIITAKKFFDSLKRLDGWGIVFVVTVVLWAVALLLALYLLIVIAAWYRREGGARPQTTDFYKRRSAAGASSTYEDPENRPIVS